MYLHVTLFKMRVKMFAVAFRKNVKVFHESGVSYSKHDSRHVLFLYIWIPFLGFRTNTHSLCLIALFARKREHGILFTGFYLYVASIWLSHCWAVGGGETFMNIRSKSQLLLKILALHFRIWARTTERKRRQQEVVLHSPSSVLSPPKLLNAAIMLLLTSCFLVR